MCASFSYPPMTCTRCKEPGKKFTMLPSRKRLELVEPYCPTCIVREKYERAMKQKEKAK